jgi:hypothetical protein
MCIFSVNSAGIDKAIKKKIRGEFADKRGRHTPRNKTLATDVEFVKKHINEFPCYVSHYSKEHSLEEGISQRHPEYFGHVQALR